MLKDRKVVLAGGVALAMLAGLGIAVALGGRHKGPEPVPVSAAEAGALHVEMGKEEDANLDPARPLRCFVGGQFVGMETLTNCAKKNGVATGALDVGLDQTGEIAATTGASSVLQPLPPPPATVVETQPAPAPKPVETPVQPAAASGPTAACWRFNGVDWRRLPEEMSLNDCVQTLYAGRCERPGDADYGRWGGDTLRRVTGRIERSGDNRNFRLLAPQRPGDCAIARVD